MRRAQCQNADLSSDIRTRPIWNNTISEVDWITKNSLVDWQQCNKWRGGCSWELQQMAAWRCLAHATLLLSLQKKKARCDIKFVKWLVRKNRALTMARQDDELNEFIDEVNAEHTLCLATK
jgi:hypothetical protein